ncbi:hypothetical protein LTS18_011828, partial [Coniosporium uncinatum]
MIRPQLHDAGSGSDAPVTPTPVRRHSNLGPNGASRQSRVGPEQDSPTSTTQSKQDGSAKNAGPRYFELSADQVRDSNTTALYESSLNLIMPEESRYELFNRLRVARAFAEGQNSRQAMVAVRLLAVANLAYVYPDAVFQQKISQLDNEEPKNYQLSSQLAALLSPPGETSQSVSLELQTIALHTLEALTKQKSKAVDIFGTLSVNVSHGVLFYVVRRAIAQLASGKENDSMVEEEWREALFSLLNGLPASTTRAGETMVTAGLLGVLVDVLKLRTPKAERTYPKILNFLDTFVYNLQNAFTALVEADGLTILAQLAAHEVELSTAFAAKGEGMPLEYKTKHTDYAVPYHQQQTLRWLFKFINHMMSHNSGTHDRLLRNLMDSAELLEAIRKVLVNAPTFGSTVWSSAVNILSSFIHNEPTSYNVIAEAGLSNGFLEAVTLPSKSKSQIAASSVAAPTVHEPLGTIAHGILPVAEAISAVPQAFGAICLNENGMKLFQDS